MCRLAWQESTVWLNDFSIRPKQSFDISCANYNHSRMSTPPDRRLVFLLNVAHRRVQRYVEAKMAAKGGLTAAQSGALFVLGQKDGALIGEAAEALDLAP